MEPWDWYEMPSPARQAGGSELCTGVSARWCPIHGTCTCRNREEAMDDDDCPLHAWNSTHGDLVVFDTIWGRFVSLSG